MSKNRTLAYIQRKGNQSLFVVFAVNKDVILLDILWLHIKQFLAPNTRFEEHCNDGAIATGHVTLVIIVFQQLAGILFRKRLYYRLFFFDPCHLRNKQYQYNLLRSYT